MRLGPMRAILLKIDGKMVPTHETRGGCLTIDSPHAPRGRPRIPGPWAPVLISVPIDFASCLGYSSIEQRIGRPTVSHGWEDEILVTTMISKCNSQFSNALIVDLSRHRC